MPRATIVSLPPARLQVVSGRMHHLPPTARVGPLPSLRSLPLRGQSGPSLTGPLPCGAGAGLSGYLLPMAGRASPGVLVER